MSSEGQMFCINPRGLDSIVEKEADTLRHIPLTNLLVCAKEKSKQQHRTGATGINQLIETGYGILILITYIQVCISSHQTSANQHKSL